MNLSSAELAKIEVKVDIPFKKFYINYNYWYVKLQPRRGLTRNN